MPGRVPPRVGLRKVSSWLVSESYDGPLSERPIECLVFGAPVLCVDWRSRPTADIGERKKQPSTTMVGSRLTDDQSRLSIPGSR